MQKASCSHCISLFLNVCRAQYTKKLPQYCFTVFFQMLVDLNKINAKPLDLCLHAHTRAPHRTVGSHGQLQYSICITYTWVWYNAFLLLDQ